MAAGALPHYQAEAVSNRPTHTLPSDAQLDEVGNQRQAALLVD
jgi:hypothetical protein